jgi:hypothetical protein
MDCEMCGGAGKVDFSCSDNLGVGSATKPCPDCDGRGVELEPIQHSSAPEPEPWGWWNVFEEQRTLAEDLNANLPALDALQALSESTHAELTDRLGRVGSALGYLHLHQGGRIGRLKALKETFDTAMDVAKSRLPRAELKSTTSEATKFQMVMERESSKPLRELRKHIIELEAQVGLADGYIRAYERAWETLSRALTSRTSEMAMETRR